MTDLVKRLRDWTDLGDRGIAGLTDQAADEIDRLRARLVEAEQLLRDAQSLYQAALGIGTPAGRRPAYVKHLDKRITSFLVWINT